MIRLHALVDRTLIVIFIATLCLPMTGMVLNLDRDAPSGENRTLAAWPQFRWDAEALRMLPEQLTRYFEDHFAFRERLVRWQAIVRLNGLGVSPSASVIKGRDGWLFYADDGAMEDYAEAPPFTGAELEQWRHTLQDTSDWLRAKGITYVFVIAPDKHVIYNEYMPETIRRSAISRIDELVSYLREHSSVRVVDLRPALFAAKARERLYHRTDTHWNDRGAFVGYQSIIEALTEEVPALQHRPRSAFEPRVVRSPGLDLAGMLGLTEVLSEEDLVLVPTRPATARILEPQNPNQRLTHARIVTEAPNRGPRAVVFMDSFGPALVPFLSEEFSRVVYLWQDNVDLQVVQQEGPQVVIHEWVGRALSTHDPYNPVPGVSAASIP
ncbi:MAG TPA: hypothetical protein VMS40_08695 [Vicinamibacterales bacterium]|nr:hypothetical protein [Vicinamibacterales bacterium]